MRREKVLGIVIFFVLCLFTVGCGGGGGGKTDPPSAQQVTLNGNVTIRSGEVLTNPYVVIESISTQKVLAQAKLANVVGQKNPYSLTIPAGQPDDRYQILAYDLPKGSTILNRDKDVCFGGYSWVVLHYKKNLYDPLAGESWCAANMDPGPEMKDALITIGDITKISLDFSSYYR